MVYCYNLGYMSITWVAIEFRPYYLISLANQMAHFNQTFKKYSLVIAGPSHQFTPTYLLCSCLPPTDRHPWVTAGH